MPKLPSYVFDLCYEKRCKICNNDEHREEINRMLYRYYKGEKEYGRDLSFRFIIDYFESKDIVMPSLASVQRHFNAHLVYYVENKLDIKASLIAEYKTRNSDKFRNETAQDEIRRRFEQIEEGVSKLKDVFPPTGYNSETGEGGPKLTWEKWCYIHLKVEIDGQLIPMVIPPHVGDLLRIIDKYLGILLLIARGHLKSTLLQIYTLRKLCDWKLRFLFLGRTRGEVERYTENIRSQLEENEMILYNYGYILKTANKKGLFLVGGGFRHDAHLSYATPPSNSSGTSKLGGHPDVIVADDLQGEDIKQSDKLKRKHEDWFDRNILPMRKGKTKLIVAGTRKDTDDLYHYIKIKGLLLTLEKPAIIKFPNGEEDDYKLVEDKITRMTYYDGGQQESILDEEGKWFYHKTEVVESVAGKLIQQTLTDGVEGLEGGEVFWDEFRKDAWDDRPVKYLNKDGSYNKTLMTMQELLLEKYYLEADEEKGHFSFWSEFQLTPIETKGRHFDVTKVNFFSYETWKKIVTSETIPKQTWIDVGYANPNTKQKAKALKKGKTVMCTAALIIPGREGYEGFTDEEGGVYILEVKSGNYFLQHHDPKKSLSAQLIRVNNHFHPITICFEDNFFGLYIRTNAELLEELENLPIDGKNNKLDKMMRISSGVNSRLSKTNRGLWLCQEALGFGPLYRQITEFPYLSKNDEIDAMESCDRILLRTSGKVVLIGDFNAFSSKNTGLSTTLDQPRSKNSLTRESYRYNKNRSDGRSRRGLRY